MATYWVTEAGSVTNDGSSYANAMDIATANSTLINSGTAILVDSDIVYFAGLITTQVVIGKGGSAAGLEIQYRWDDVTYPGTSTTTIGIDGVHLGASFVKIAPGSSGCGVEGVKILTSGAWDGIIFDGGYTNGNGSYGVGWVQSANNNLSNIQFTNGFQSKNKGNAGVRLTIEVNTSTAGVIAPIFNGGCDISGNTRNNLKLGNSGFDTPRNNQDLVIDNITTNDCLTDPADANHAGGNSIYGFTSSTSAYGKQTITNATSSNNYGVNGGYNLLSCQYIEGYSNVTNGNKAYTDSTLSTVTIDAHGILIDELCSYIKWHDSESSNNEGNTTNYNTGCGVMVLSADHCEVYNMHGTGNNHGDFIGGAGAHTGTTVHDNKWLACISDGTVVAPAVTDDTLSWYSNTYIGTGGAYGVNNRGGATQTNDHDNIYLNFGNPTNNHTFGYGTRTHTINNWNRETSDE